MDINGTNTADFSALWADTSRHLRRVLNARRVPARVIDDLVQETGLRLFSHWAEVDPERIWPFTLTIATNLIRDEMRKEAARPECVELNTERPETLDFDAHMLNRLELHRVKKALRSLSTSDRSVLLAEWGESDQLEPTSPAALKMARMRARRRLRAVLEHASGLIPVGLRWRRPRFLEDPAFASIPQQLSQVAIALVMAGGPAAMGATVAAGGNGLADRSSVHATLASFATSRSAGHEDGGHLSAAPKSTQSDPQGATVSARKTQQAEQAKELNENFGPVRNGDDGLHVGEGGNGFGPYGTEREVEARPANKKMKAKARATYEPPHCEEDISIGGQSETPKCDGAGNAEAETETDEDGHKRSKKIDPL
jgi:DNA-directed RNA polymerase specialized sigma24 family protein